MAGIPEEIIEEIRGRADIVEIVSDYLPLKKSGANWRALCPFHEEKTPSFNVNPERNIFHCFGCGEGGNVFTFVMKMENVSFPEAVRLLARRYGVAIPERGGRRQDTELDRLYEAVEAAARFYRELLLGQEPGSPVMEYAGERGLTGELIEKFRLGWAPEAWDALSKRLSDRGFGMETLEKAGLVKKSSKGNYIDRFRARLIFPIMSAGGKVIGFGGRTLPGAPPGTPKYMNSPDSPIYNKSRALYGWPQAQGAARREGFMILVEGYMDVLALHREGVENCVAVSGTAFTGRQAELIRRACGSVVALFDSDAAGIAAAKRSVPILLDHDIAVRVLTLPGAKDPDDFLKEHSAEEFRRLVDEAPSFPVFIIEATLSGADLGSVEGRAKAAREVIPYLRRIKDNIERSQYLHVLADRTGTDYEVLKDEAGRGGGRPEGAVSPKAEKPKTPPSHNTEKVLARILLEKPEYLKSVASGLTADDFTSPDYRSIFDTLREAVLKGADSAAEVMDMAPDDKTRQGIAALSMEKNLFDEKDAEAAARDLVNRIKYSPERRRRILDELKSATRAGDLSRFRQAQEKYLEFRGKQI
ncbi:MAG: DNA primase [Candidatus Nitrospinota bacterium M3_3B_026]